MTELIDDFRGDDAHLIRSIRALINLSDAGALVPHGIGGHARSLLSAAAARLSRRPAAAMVPACGDPDCNACDLVAAPSASAQQARVKGAWCSKCSAFNCECAAPAPSASPAALTDEQIDAIRQAISVLNHYSMAPDSINAVSGRILNAMLAASPINAVQIRTDGFRDCIDAIKGALAFGQQGSNPPPEGHWLAEFWQIGRKLAASPADQVGASRILKGVGKINGDGWKDTTVIGEVVYAWHDELPKPYAPGQYPRVGNPIWSASTNQYDFTELPADEFRQVIDGLIERIRMERNEAVSECERLKGKVGASAAMSASKEGA